LLRIFNNLISNAIKYTSSGNIKVKVSIEDINSLKYTVIDIIDTGIGISDNFHDIVFEPFRQVSEGLSRIFEGTGLGLAITKRLVEILNGSITFVSIPGKGSTFTVRFPFTSDDNFSKTVNQRKISNHLKTKNNKLPSEIKILVVEDDISNALMIKTYIEDYFTVEHVINGYDAIEKCRSRQYDGILMDINLKGIDGVETFKHIRLLNDHYSQVPVIAVTAYAMKGDKEKFMAYGFDQYISKPFKQSELLDKMFGVLNLKPG